MALVNGNLPLLDEWGGDPPRNVGAQRGTLNRRSGTGGRGSEQAISLLATYLSEVSDGFDLDEFLRRLRTVRGPRPVRLRVGRGKELFLKRLAARIKEQV